jgi:hypothetical protein
VPTHQKTVHSCQIAVLFLTIPHSVVLYLVSLTGEGLLHGLGQSKFWLAACVSEHGIVNKIHIGVSGIRADDKSAFHRSQSQVVKQLNGEGDCSPFSLAP